MQTGLVAAGALALGSEFWEQALAAKARKAPSPYGALGPPDANGLRLPEGFTSRVIGEGGAAVPGTDYQWHIFPDGASTFRTPDKGWILVSNSEVPTAPDLAGEVPLTGNPGDGGASAVRFGPDGEIRDAYRILSGTSTNCAGGATPWGTWLSCEETDEGLVWECDPTGRQDARPRPALGAFIHEAACVDPRRGHVYLTEDDSEGGFYRFTPRRKGDLSKGRLEIARVGRRGRVKWKRVPDPSAAAGPTREQVDGSTKFDRGEGIWFDSGTVYVATTGDSRIRAYDVARERIRVLYDPKRVEDPPLTDVDNITVSRAGELFVCEDNGGEDPFDIALITLGRRPKVSRFLKLTGPQHGNAETEATSEVAGVCFNPRGDRMYFSSQRAFVTGVTYEVKGPFRRRRRRR